MKILESESEIRKIGLFIGRPIRKGVVGSTTYYVKRLHYEGESSHILEEHKAIFELFSDGLLMRTLKNNNRKIVPLPYSMIVRIRLRKGQEEISPLMFSHFGRYYD